MTPAARRLAGRLVGAGWVVMAVVGVIAILVAVHAIGHPCGETWCWP